MLWQFNTFALIYSVATILTSVILVYTLRHRQVKGAFFFAFLVASVVVWALFQALEYAIAETTVKILFAKFQYLGISTVGTTWYLFAFSYNRKENWLSKNYLFLLVIPVLIIIAAFTNDAHGLLWPKIEPISSDPDSNLIYSHGPAFWIIFVYNYIFLVMGTVLIIRTAVNSKEIYRWQMVGLISSAIIPWVGNLVYVSGLSPIPGLDLTPLGFTVSALVTAWSIFFLRLLDLLPVAYDQVVANLTDGVIVLDIHHRIADANPQARQLLGEKAEYIVGRNILDVLQFWPDLVKKLQDFDTGQLEIAVDNEKISDLDIRISPLLDNRDNRVGRIVIFRDISQQKKLERMRQELTQSIVNDLRNPLTSMALNLDTLRRQTITLLPKNQLEVIDLSQSSIQQMLDLTSSLLDIYHLQSGELSLDLKKTSLQSLAEDSVRPLSALANKKRLLLQVDIPDGMQPVTIDPNLIRRVLQNLLGNSIKLSKEGRVVRLHARYDTNGETIISVIDAGNDLDPALIGNTFQKPISGQLNSGGLGLAFCRLAVEAHGGRIWVDESYENGTKISFTLP
jgi:PAS domain S-box-containing protein